MQILHMRMGTLHMHSSICTCVHTLTQLTYAPVILRSMCMHLRHANGQEEAAEEALLAKIEEELRLLDPLADMLEEQEMQQAQRHEAPGLSPLHAIRAAHELAHDAGEAEISNALRVQLLGLDGRTSLHKSLAEALEVAAKLSESTATLATVICNLCNRLVSTLRDTLQSVFESSQGDQKVRQALQAVQLVGSVAVATDRLASGTPPVPPILEMMCHSDLLLYCRNMQAQLQVLSEENNRLKTAASTTK